MVNAAPLDPKAPDVRLFAFADALRSEVNLLIRQMGTPAALVEGFQAAGLMPSWVRAEKPLEKQRTLLQWRGESRRKEDPNYWVKRLFQRLAVLQPDIAVITDLRYPNEVTAVKAAGGYVGKIVRVGPSDVEVHEHESETALDWYDGWDFTIEASTLAELKNTAVAVFSDIVHERKTCSTST